MDASTTHVGILLQGISDETEAIELACPQRQIYLGELAAAFFGSFATNKPHTVASDNQAAVNSMLKGHSTTRAGNALLAAWLERSTATHIAWVPTKRQRADFLTRPYNPPPRVPRWYPRPEAVRWRKKQGGLQLMTTSFSSKRPTVNSIEDLLAHLRHHHGQS